MMYCTVPNIKGGPDILLGYRVLKRIEPDMANVMGSVRLAGDNTQLGHFNLIVGENSLEIDKYYPVGVPPIEGTWDNPYMNKGISQTFLFWMSNFAILNSVDIVKVESPWMFNYHVFRKYFADEFKVSDRHISMPWQRFSDVERKFYDDIIVGQVELADCETFSSLGNISLTNAGDNSYSVEVIRPHTTYKEFVALTGCPQKDAPHGLKTGDRVTVDGKAIVRVGGKIVAYVARPSARFVNIQGKPRIPDGIDVSIDSSVREILIPESSLVVKCLGNC